MAVIYQKDKNAIKFIQEFYSKLTNHGLSQYEVDSILAQYDGDYQGMVKDLYEKLSDHRLSQEELDSIVNHYGLKKKDLADSTSDLEDGTSDLSETKTDKKTFKAQEGAIVPDQDQDVWVYNDYIGYYQKNGSNVPHGQVPENIKTKLKEEYNLKTNQEKLNIRDQQIDQAISSLGDMIETSSFDGNFSESYKIPQTKTGIETLMGLITDPRAREKLGYGYMTDEEVDSYLTKLNTAESSLAIWQQNISDEEYLNILNEEDNQKTHKNTPRVNKKIKEEKLKTKQDYDSGKNTNIYGISANMDTSVFGPKPITEENAQKFWTGQETVFKAPKINMPESISYTQSFPNITELVNFGDPFANTNYVSKGNYNYLTQDGVNAYNSLLDLAYEFQDIQKEKGLILEEAGVKNWNDLPENLKTEYVALNERESVINDAYSEGPYNQNISIYNQSIMNANELVAKGQTVSSDPIYDDNDKNEFLVFNYDVFSNKKIDNAQLPLDALTIDDISEEQFKKLQFEYMENISPLYSPEALLFGDASAYLSNESGLIDSLQLGKNQKYTQKDFTAYGDPQSFRNTFAQKYNMTGIVRLSEDIREMTAGKTNEEIFSDPAIIKAMNDYEYLFNKNIYDRVTATRGLSYEGENAAMDGNKTMTMFRLGEAYQRILREENELTNQLKNEKLTKKEKDALANQLTQLLLTKEKNRSIYNDIRKEGLPGYEELFNLVSGEYSDDVKLAPSNKIEFDNSVQQILTNREKFIQLYNKYVEDFGTDAALHKLKDNMHNINGKIMHMQYMHDNTFVTLPSGNKILVGDLMNYVYTNSRTPVRMGTKGTRGQYYREVDQNPYLASDQIGLPDNMFGTPDPTTQQGPSIGTSGPQPLYQGPIIKLDMDSYGALNPKKNNFASNMSILFGKGYEKEDLQFMYELASKFAADYQRNWNDLVGVSEIIAWNYDPTEGYSERTGAGLFAESMGTEIARGAKNIGSFLSTLSGGFAYEPNQELTEIEQRDQVARLLQEGTGQMTEDAKQESEFAWSQTLGSGTGMLFVIVAELIATRKFSLSAINKLNKLGDLSQNVKKYKKIINSSRVGRVSSDIFKETIVGASSFELTSGDQVTWRMGAAEGFVQSTLSNLFFGKSKYANLLLSAYKKAPNTTNAAYWTTRTGLGGTSEILAEYAGEFTQNLNNLNGNWNEAWEMTFGATKDEALKKFAVTAILCYGASGAFNLRTAKGMELELQKFVDSGIGPDGQPLSEEARAQGQDYLDAINEHKKGPMGEQIDMFENMTWEETSEAALFKLDQEVDPNFTAPETKTVIINGQPTTVLVDPGSPVYSVDGNSVSKEDIIKFINEGGLDRKDVEVVVENDKEVSDLVENTLNKKSDPEELIDPNLDFDESVNEYKGSDLGGGKLGQGKEKAKVVQASKTEKGKEIVNDLKNKLFENKKTVTVYRVGSLNDGHNPFTTSKEMAETLSKERGEQGLSTEIITLEVTPDDVSVVIPGAEGEIFVELNDSNRSRLNKQIDFKSEEFLQQERNQIQEEINTIEQNIEKRNQALQEGKLNENLVNDQNKKDERKLINLRRRLGDTTNIDSDDGKQLDLFEGESTRSYAGNSTNVPAGQRVFNDPNPGTTQSTKDYIAKNAKNLGIDYTPPQVDDKRDEERSKRIADAYDSMENNPEDPKTKSAYEALSKEVQMQYNQMVSDGVEVEIWEGTGEPYANSDQMIKDVRDNNHLYIYSTLEGYGEAEISEKAMQDNPLLRPTEQVDINNKPLLVNDLFRAVHDYYGHTELGNGFGVIGEEIAWQNHSRMFSPNARRAMTTETRGQNSWVNFNKNLRNQDGTMPKKGDNNYVSPKERPFADQKIGLLPDEFVFVERKNVRKNPGDRVFKFDLNTATYKGAINGREIEIKKNPWKKEWTEVSTGQVIGRTFGESVDNLRNVFKSVQGTVFSSDPNLNTKSFENAKISLEASTSEATGVQPDVVVKPFIDSESIINKIKKRRYTKLQLEAIQKALVKIQEAKADPTSMPLEIVLEDGGIVINDKNQVVFKTYGYSFSDSPLLEGMNDQQKIEFSSERMIQDFNSRRSISDPDFGWYSKTKDAIQKKFGSNANLFIELLGVTSPQASPKANFQKASEAIQMYSQGYFDTALENYNTKVQEIIEKFDSGKLGNPDLVKTRNKMISMIKQASENSGITKMNGMKFGITGTTGAITRVLYGNWMSNSPGLKTKQFTENLSGRNKRATIDVWAARNLKRLLYADSGLPWRARSFQENGVSPKDFAFAQSVYARAAEKLGVNIDDLQAAMWFIEKQFWFDNNYDSSKSGFEKATMLDQVEASNATERMMIGATAYIGNVTAEQKARLEAVGSKAGADAKARGASDIEIEAAMIDAMQGELRLNQAVVDLNDVIVKLNPEAGRVSLSEGVYMNQAEPSIDAEVLFTKGTDITSVVDQVIKIGLDNNQESVFVSKTTDSTHPNARPFTRIEFTESLSDSEMAEVSNILTKNGITGFSIHKNQQGQNIGLSFQFIPEFLIDQGLTLENVKEFETKHLQNTAKALAEIQSTLGENIINTIENGHVNTKIFTNGEYETIKQEQKSFETNIQTELTRRQGAVDRGDVSKDIIDKRQGDVFDERGIQRFHVLNEFADRLKELRKALGTRAYSDPFMITPTIKAGLFVMEKTLRATSNIATSIDAGINYIKSNLKEGEKFTKKQEDQIRDYFKNEIESVERPGGIDANKDSDLEGNQEITEEEMAQRELDEESVQEDVTEDAPSINETPTKEELSEENMDNMLDDLQTRTRSKMSGGKRQSLRRLFEYIRSGRFRDDAMIQLVEPKFVIKKRLQQLADQYNMGEAEFEALSQLTLWLQAPGAAKSEIDEMNTRLWRDENNIVIIKGKLKKGGKALTKGQIENIGMLNALERIIQLDQLSDQNKVVVDAIIKEINASKDPDQIKELKAQLDKLLDPAVSRMGYTVEDGKYKLVAKVNPDGDLVEGNLVEVPTGINYKGDQYHRRKHPKAKDNKTVNKEYAEGMIEAMKRREGPKEFDLIKRKSDQVFDEYKRVLKEDYEEGLISEELYNELKDINYSPRKFIDYLIFSERNVLNLRGDNQYRVDGIDKYMQTLKHGSDGILYTDPVRLLQQRIALAHKLRFENRSRKGIYEFIKTIENAETTQDPVQKKRFSNLFGLRNGKPITVKEAVGHTLKPGESVNPETHIEVQVMEDGKKIKFAMTIDAYRSFIATPHDTNIQKGQLSLPLKILEGFFGVPGKILKTFATGVGAPTFFLVNLVLDFTQQTHFTDTYSGGRLWWRSMLPIKYGMAFSDWMAVSRDAFVGGERSKEYARLGGNLEFFTDYGLGGYGSVMEISQGNIAARVKQLMEQEGMSEVDAVEQATREEGSAILQKNEYDAFTNPESRGSWNTAKSWMSKLNQWSETMARLANMRRWEIRYINEYKKKNGGAEPTGVDLERIKKRAVANAVETANFNNGGRAIKAMDKAGFSYLNAAWQVMYRGAKHIKRNPGIFIYEATQYGLMFGMALMAYNLRKYKWTGEEEEDDILDQLDKANEEGNEEEIQRLERYLKDKRKPYLDFIPDYERDRYHIIITGWNDEQGRPKYYKIRKDERLSFVNAPFESLAYKSITGKDYDARRNNIFNYTPVIGLRGDERDIYGRRFQNALPPGLGDYRDILTSSPMLNLVSKTVFNYDTWRDRKIWNNPDAMGMNQYEYALKSDDKLIKDLSQLLGKTLGNEGFNVTQWKEGVGSIFTNLDKNPWYQLIDNAYISVTGGLTDNEKLEYGSMFNKMLEDAVPGLVETKFSGSIDLTRRTDLDEQQEIDEVFYEDKLDQANYSMAFKEALRTFKYRVDPSGFYVDKDGVRIKQGEYQQQYIDDSYVEIAEATLEAYKIRNKRSGIEEPKLTEDDYNSIYRRVKSAFEYDYLKDDKIKQLMYHYDNGNIETAAFIAFTEWKDKTENQTKEDNARFVNVLYDLRVFDNKEFEDMYYDQIDIYKNDVSK